MTSNTTTLLSLPETQRAWKVTKQGLPKDVLQLTTIPIPTLKSGEVLVKIEAAALNPHGYLMMGFPSFVNAKPRIAEMDFVGQIVANPFDVSGFSVGEKVIGLVGMRNAKDTQGSLCQYVAATEEEIVRVPKRLSVEQAAGFTACALTAFRALNEVATVKSGDRVFVNGGSSSLGRMFIQVSKEKGCIVHASCSPRNDALVKASGADQTFDYTASPLPAQLSAYVASASTPYDLIVDCVGSSWPLWLESKTYLAPNGTFLEMTTKAEKASDFFCEMGHSISAFARPKWMGGVDRKFKMCMGKHTSVERMQAFGKYLETSMITPNVDSVFEFEDALKAYERIMTGRATGKIVVRVPQD